MRGLRAGLFRRAEADDAGHPDEAGPVGHTARLVQSAAHGGQVVGVVHVLHVPAIGGEARRHVLVEGEVRAALDCDVVAVVDPGEVAEPQMRRHGRRLAADPLHHVAVAGQHVDVVVEQLVARLVVAAGEEALGHRQAHRVAATLAQRAGGGLHARGDAVLGMAGRLAVHLTELLEVVNRQGRGIAVLVLVDGTHAGQVDQRVEQHRGVADGQHEAVVPGWPEFAFCTASIASVRMVLMQSWSSLDASMVADILCSWWPRSC